MLNIHKYLTSSRGSCCKNKSIVIVISGNWEFETGLLKFCPQCGLMYGFSSFVVWFHCVFTGKCRAFRGAGRIYIKICYSSTFSTSLNYYTSIIKNVATGLFRVAIMSGVHMEF